jgi:hypothetical protein
MGMKKVATTSKSRRGFLAMLAALSAGLLSTNDRTSGKPRELSLREADYYKPHDLAG